MAVLVTARPALQPLAQGRDERSPVSFWQAFVSADGDLTGGALEARLLFTSGLLWSVEEEYCSQTGGLAQIMLVSLLMNQFLSTRRLRTHLLEVIAGASVVAIQGDQLPMLQGQTTIFQPDDNTSRFLSIQGDNTAAADQVQVRAWGYCWSLEALKLVGGPRKPFWSVAQP